jgi:hypothetical protein
LSGRAVLTVSPGALRGDCRISADELVANCHLGAGRATVIADADFLNANQLGSAGRGNADALLAELATLEHP